MTKLILFIFSAWAFYYGYHEYNIGRYLSETGHDITYGKANLSAEIDGREVDFIVVNQRYKNDSLCDDGTIDTYLSQMCTSSLGCSPKKYTCDDTIDTQYQHMLDQKNAGTHYLHVTDGETGLASVMLFWGLTNKESESNCIKLKNSFASNKKLNIKARCI